MGLRTSPHQAVQTGLQLKHIALGERKDPKNVFRWETVRLNLPGDPVRLDSSLGVEGPRGRWL